MGKGFIVYHFPDEKDKDVAPPISDSVQENCSSSKNEAVHETLGRQANPKGQQSQTASAFAQVGLGFKDEHGVEDEAAGDIDVQHSRADPASPISHAAASTVLNETKVPGNERHDEKKHEGGEMKDGENAAAPGRELGLFDWARQPQPCPSTDPTSSRGQVMPNFKVFGDRLAAQRRSGSASDCRDSADRDTKDQA